MRWLGAALRHLAKRTTLRPQHHARGFVVALQLLLYRYNHANRKSPRVRAVPAVTRAIAILRLLSRSRTPQGLKAIAEES